MIVRRLGTGEKEGLDLCCISHQVLHTDLLRTPEMYARLPVEQKALYINKGRSGPISDRCGGTHRTMFSLMSAANQSWCTCTGHSADRH